MPNKVGNVLNWASDIEENTLAQAAKTSRLPFVAGHVALMPDAHFGMGSTVGSVIPTSGAIIPAAIGVDIGCGMIAVETDLRVEHLPDDLRPLLSLVEASVPSGVGKGHTFVSDWDRERQTRKVPAYNGSTSLSTKQVNTIIDQFATLGSGNHFVEVCLDERDVVWVVLHSGSRGIGNQLASAHIKTAKELMKQNFIVLEDPDLAYLVENTPEFDAYIADMLWAQKYAFWSRDVMVDRVVQDLFEVVGFGREKNRINSHHNYTERENHGGKNVWLTRKGAVRARVGDYGVIPGSMGASTYIVEGLGNPASYNSCSHGAGRRMGRNEAKRKLTVESLEAQMGERTWLHDARLLDEHPLAYKDIDQVMEDQKDLVRIEHKLHQVLNFKGL